MRKLGSNTIYIHTKSLKKILLTSKYMRSDPCIHPNIEEMFSTNPTNRPADVINICLLRSLKVRLCKIYNNKYIIALTQITNTEVFAFIAVLVFKLLSCKALLINVKDNRNC